MNLIEYRQPAHPARHGGQWPQHRHKARMRKRRRNQRKQPTAVLGCAVLRQSENR